MVAAGHVKYLQSTLSDSSRGVAYWQSTAFDYRYTGLVFLPDLTFDKENRILSSPVKSLQLTAKEAELLSILIQNPEILFNREQLVAKIWGSSAEVEAGNVDNYISFIRKRLKELQSACKITTVYGAGYKLEKSHVK